MIEFQLAEALGDIEVLGCILLSDSFTRSISMSLPMFLTAAGLAGFNTLLENTLARLCVGESSLSISSSDMERLSSPSPMKEGDLMASLLL